MSEPAAIASPEGVVAPAAAVPLAIALLSGGLDSATAAALALESGHRVIGLSFDYGQRHRRELQAAASVSRRLGLLEHRVLQVDLAAWGGSSLTDPAQALPADGVQPDGIPSTYVPGRNTVFIALGLSLAEAVGASRLVLGVNAVDYSGYPDCRPDYLAAFQTLADLASRAGREGRGVQLWAPLVEWDKPRIVREALRLGVPLEATWSCYAGGLQPCGVCDSCRIRDKALIAVGRSDLAGLHREGVKPLFAPPQATVRGAADDCADPPKPPAEASQATAADRAGRANADSQPQEPAADPGDRLRPDAAAAPDLPQACGNVGPAETGSPL